jgi:hypothetical protein
LTHESVDRAKQIVLFMRFIFYVWNFEVFHFIVEILFIAAETRVVLAADHDLVDRENRITIVIKFLLLNWSLEFLGQFKMVLFVFMGDWVSIDDEDFVKFSLACL